MPDNPTSVIPAAVAKALSDKLYDKQRAATLKIEQMVRTALEADDDHLIYQIIAELTTDFATSERESSRIGGLVALGSVSTALTHVNIPQFLPQMILPIISAMSDGESKVRYFACESLYNVAKVSRGHVLRWFNEIFDGLARVTADSVKIVKNGADYLDRLVKDIVAEQAATCLDWYDAEDAGAEQGVVANNALQIFSGIGEPAMANPAEPSTVVNGLLDPQSLPADAQPATSPSISNHAAAPVLRSPRLAFSLENFIPLLSERMHTYKPSTRLYLIEWIRVLDSVPGLDLISYLPEFLDGLIRFLSDPNDDVRTKTQSVLGELLLEIRECVEIQRFGNAIHDDDGMGWGEPEEGREQELSAARVRSSTMQSDVHVEGRVASSFRKHPMGSFTSPHHQQHYGNGGVSQQSSRAPSVSGHHAQLGSRQYASGFSSHQAAGHFRAPGSQPLLVSSALVSGQLSSATGELRMAARRNKVRALRSENALVPGVAVVIEFAACIRILVPHLESNDQEIQGVALHWMYEFSWICPDVMLGFVPTLLNALLPSVSHPVAILRHTAEDANRRLYELVSDAPAPATEQRQRVVEASKPAAAKHQQQESEHLPRPTAASSSRPLPPVTSTTAVAAATSSVVRPKSPAFSMNSVTSSAHGPVVANQALAGTATRSRAESLLHASTVSPVASMAPSRVNTPAPQMAGEKRVVQSPPPMGGRDRRESVSAAVSPSEHIVQPTHQQSSLGVVADLESATVDAGAETVGSSLQTATVGGDDGHTAKPAEEEAEESQASDDGNGEDRMEYMEVIVEPFNYEHAATSIMELFAKNVHEQTKVSGMRWLLLLHRKAPWRILTPSDMSFPVLLKMLGDPSEQVVRLNLELFAQISLYSQSKDPEGVSYLSRFFGSLLQMFATSRVLLETRAALMVRQLCVVLDPELVFCLLAKLLALPGFGVTSSSWNAPAPARGGSEVGDGSDDEDDDQSEDDESSESECELDDAAGHHQEDEPEEDVVERLADLEFVSVMVQHLSWILVTAPETEGLRVLLRQYNPSMPLTMPELSSLRNPLLEAAAAGGSEKSATSAFDLSVGMASGDAPEPFLSVSPKQQQQQQQQQQMSLPTASRRRGTSQGSAVDTPAQTLQPKPTKLVRNPAATSRGGSSSSGGGRGLASSRTSSTGALRGGTSSARQRRSRSGTNGGGVDSAAERDRRRIDRQTRQRAQEQAQAQARAQSLVAAAVARVKAAVGVNQRSHRLFTTLFRTWSHSPAACLTLCLLSQHYETATALIGILGNADGQGGGQRDLTVSFLVQLDKLVQLIESPVFAYLRLQLLDPAAYPHLVRALYGLLMLLPQSSAFAILRNRLSSVAMLSFPQPAMSAQIVPGRSANGAMQTQHYHHHHQHYQQAQRSTQAVDSHVARPALEQHFHYHYHSYYPSPPPVSTQQQPQPQQQQQQQQQPQQQNQQQHSTVSDGAVPSATDGGRGRSALAGMGGISAQDLSELIRLLSVSSQQQQRQTNAAATAIAPGNLGPEASTTGSAAPIVAAAVGAAESSDMAGGGAPSRATAQPVADAKVGAATSSVILQQLAALRASESVAGSGTSQLPQQQLGGNNSSAAASSSIDHAGSAGAGAGTGAGAGLSVGGTAAEQMQQPWTVGGQLPGGYWSEEPSRGVAGDGWAQPHGPVGSDLSRHEIEVLLEAYKAVRARYSRAAAREQSR